MPCHGGADLLFDEVEPVGIDGVGLGERDSALAHAQQAQDLQMLGGLRHDAVVGGDDEQRIIDGGGAGHHVADQAFMAGNVDDGGDIVEKRVAQDRW